MDISILKRINNLAGGGEHWYVFHAINTVSPPLGSFERALEIATRYGEELLDTTDILAPFSVKSENGETRPYDYTDHVVRATREALEAIRTANPPRQ